MRFTKDSFERITPPNIILRKASGERIGIIPTTELTLDVNLNDFNVLTFTSYLYIDNEKNPYYDYLQDMMYIETEDDLYVITNVDTQSEGQTVEHKQVTAKTYEWMLSTRYLEDFVINTGAVESIDGVNLYSLLNMCISELFPEWSISPGDIHGSLATVQRSFEISRSSVYDFLMNDVAQAFECIFVFNTLNKSISVYPESMYGQESGVMVSYENLLKDTNMTLEVDTIKTSLVVTGAEDVNIREISRSSDRIYNFNYYNSTEFMSESLYNAYNAWQTLTYNTPVNWSYLNQLYDASNKKYFVFDNTKDLDGNYVMNYSVIQSQYSSFIAAHGLPNNYNSLYTFLLSKYQHYFSDISKWNSTNIPYGNNARYFGYGVYPADYPTSKSDSALVSNPELANRYTSVVEVDSASKLPATGNVNTLYLIKMPADTSSFNFALYRWCLYKNKYQYLNVNQWNNTALAPLNEKLKSAEGNSAAAMKKGYGNRSANSANYIKYYLPYYYSECALRNYIYGNSNLSIQGVTQKISIAETCQARISKAMECIANLTAMANANTIKQGSTFINPNFNNAQLKELSTFIREDELNSDNYVVTESMTDEERFSMLNDLLAYGTKELDKVAQPQITFSASVLNLFNMSEFDRYSGYVDIGNKITVSLRDDYLVKPRITNIHINYYDESDFSLTFSNILRKSRDYYTDIQDAINEAHSAATSVSFNASYWSQQSRNADTISQQLSQGLLEAGNFLKSGIHSEFLVDDRGVFVTTVSDDPSDPNYSYAKTSETDTSYDSIYIGGGRILFTNDGWKTVKMSVGRGTVAYPDSQLKVETSGGHTYARLNMTNRSMFGVFADFVVSGYIGSSTIVGGKIYSSNYRTNRDTPNIDVLNQNYGSFINLDDGTFEFNNNGKKKLTLDNAALKVYGQIYADQGKIGCNSLDPINTGWTIAWSNSRGVIYSGKKKTLNDTNDGIYIGTDGIVLGSGAYNQAPFSVLANGTLRSTSGTIGGFTITESSLYTQKPESVADNAICLSIKTFQRTLDLYKSKALLFAIGKNFGVGPDGTVYLSGSINATEGYIGGTNGFVIKANKIYKNKSELQADVATGIYLGIDGIGLGPMVDYNNDKVNDHSRFEVDSSGNLWCQNANVTGYINATSGTFKSINTPNVSTWWIDENGNLHAQHIYTIARKHYDMESTDMFDELDNVWTLFGKIENNIFGAKGNGIHKALQDIAKNFRVLWSNWKNTSAPNFSDIPTAFDLENGDIIETAHCVGSP